METERRWADWAGADRAMTSFLVTSSFTFTDEADLFAAGRAISASPTFTSSREPWNSTSASPAGCFGGAGPVCGTVEVAPRLAARTVRYVLLPACRACLSGRVRNTGQGASRAFCPSAADAFGRPQDQRRRCGCPSGRLGVRHPPHGGFRAPVAPGLALSLRVVGNTARAGPPSGGVLTGLYLPSRAKLLLACGLRRVNLAAHHCGAAGRQAPVLKRRQTSTQVYTVENRVCGPDALVGGSYRRHPGNRVPSVRSDTRRRTPSSLAVLRRSVCCPGRLSRQRCTP